MTGDEMERAIEFILQSQANYEARQADYEARQANYETRQARLESQMEVMIQIHTEFAQFTRANIEALNEHSRSIRETVRSLTINQARTDERLNELEREDGKT